MYPPARYASDLKRAWKSVETTSRVFGKSLPTLDPFVYGGHCLLMVGMFVGFIYVALFLTLRRAINL